MKKFNKFFKGSIPGFLILIILSLVGSEIFQGQSQESRFNYDENDPLIDRPTRESQQYIIENSDQFDIITDAEGYDNFQIGVDNAELITQLTDMTGSQVILFIIHPHAAIHGQHLTVSVCFIMVQVSADNMFIIPLTEELHMVQQF